MKPGDLPLGSPESRAAARVLLRSRQDNCKRIRELIAVPPEIEDALHFCVSHHPEDAQGIEKVLRFRERVREEFDRLVSDSLRQVSPN